MNCEHEENVMMPPRAPMCHDCYYQHWFTLPKGPLPNPDLGDYTRAGSDLWCDTTRGRVLLSGEPKGLK